MLSIWLIFSLQTEWFHVKFGDRTETVLLISSHSRYQMVGSPPRFPARVCHGKVSFHHLMLTLHWLLWRTKHVKQNQKMNQSQETNYLQDHPKLVSGCGTPSKWPKWLINGGLLATYWLDNPPSTALCIYMGVFFVNSQLSTTNHTQKKLAWQWKHPTILKMHFL